jgi:hypothetical protein
MSIDLSKLPPAHNVPGRQAIIDRAGKIHKEPFMVLYSMVNASLLLTSCRDIHWCSIWNRYSIGDRTLRDSYFQRTKNTLG